MGLLQAAVLEDALDSNAGILTLPVASEYSSRPAETATASLICEPNSHAAVAQLAEQCFRKAWVGGSSPLGGFNFCWSARLAAPTVHLRGTQRGTFQDLTPLVKCRLVNPDCIHRPACVLAHVELLCCCHAGMSHQLL